MGMKTRNYWKNDVFDIYGGEIEGIIELTSLAGRYSEMWNKWGRIWDFMLSLIGYDDAYREIAVEKLALEKGDSVLDLACGSGLNFKFLEEKVGGQGKIIALDYSRIMLEKAREKIKANNWLNITPVEADASSFLLEEEVDAVLCSWAMVSIPDYESATKCAVNGLREGGGFSVLDFQLITGVRGWLFNPVYEFIFWSTHQDITRQPWKIMQKYLANVCKQDINTKMVSCNIAWGTKPTIGVLTNKEHASNLCVLEDVQTRRE